jgi:hypothetical protein
MVMRLHPEQQIQIAVCDFCRIHKIPFYHIANERRCSMVYGKMLKRMGVTTGFADCFLPRGNATFKGLFLELKSAKGKPTASQIDFLGKMMAEGYFTAITYGTDETLLIIKQFYSIK